MSLHGFIGDSPGWETVKSETVLATPYLQVLATEIKTPARREARSWMVVHRKAAAVVAPMTREGAFVLIRQERIPIRAAIWEFPAGQIDAAGEEDEAARATALRELREEAGYELGPGGELISLGYFFSSAGFTDEHSHLFLARGVVPAASGNEPDESESILECRAFSSEELREMIAGNEIRDANTLSAYARLCAMGLLAEDVDGAGALFQVPGKSVGRHDEAVHGASG